MLKITLLIISVLFSSQLFALIGGKVAKTGEGAGVLQIVVQDNKDATINNQCTATKIREDVLLTAAHCFENLQERSSILGFTTKIDNSDFDFEGVEISKVVLHPSYVLDMMRAKIRIATMKRIHWVLIKTKWGVTKLIWRLFFLKREHHLEILLREK